MRALVTAVVVMGVLIVLGVGTVVVTVVRRIAAPTPGGAVILAEPPGTRLAAIAAAGDRLAVLLQGGGADRVLLLDPHSGAVLGRVGLAP